MIIQVFIFIFSASAIWFVGRKEHWKRWGYILGLAAQPFWFYTTISTEQWAIMSLCIWYTYSWAQGVYNYWIKKAVAVPPYIAGEVNELKKRIQEQHVYIKKIRSSDREPDRKKFLIESATSIKDTLQRELNKLLEENGVM